MADGSDGPRGAPCIFISHGAPTIAIERCDYTGTLSMRSLAFV